jgi:hypothetical protein
MVEVVDGKDMNFNEILFGSMSQPYGEGVEVPGGNPMYGFEDIVDTKTQDWIEETLLNSMEWYYNAGTTKYKHTQDPKAKDTHQFIHSISNGADKGKYYPLVEGILTNIQAKTNMEITEVCRIKANFLQPTPNWNHSMYHIPHVDIEDTTGDNCDYLSMIYYVNNSDGDTYLFDTWWGEDTSDMTVIGQCNPKKGRVILFHSNRYHASSCPVDTDKRMVLNFVLKVKEKQ